MEAITYKLTETDTKFQNQIKTLVESGNSYDTQSIFNKIKIGLLLLEIKQKNPIDFDSIIPSSIISKKTRNRRMKLILDKGCDFTKGMKVTKDTKTTKENSKLLIVDKRVKNLTEKDISNISDIYNGGLTKIEKMKGLTNTNWDKVIKGDNEPYETLSNKISEDNKTKSDNKRNENKPKGMDQKTFIEMLDSGIYNSIKSVYEFEIENKKLEKSVKSLERKIKSMEKSKNENLQKISQLSGVVTGMESVSANLSNISMKQTSKV